MTFSKTPLRDCFVLEPAVFGDERGFFFESFNQKKFQEIAGKDYRFVQDNHSRSSKGVLRGLHYQIQSPQGKLVRVISGEVLDVAVDLRRSSETFGKWFSIHLSAENKKQLWVPPGFAHGFVVLSQTADFLYKTTDFYMPQHERCILWSDADLAIDWQLEVEPVLSAKDQDGTRFSTAELY